MSTCRFPEHHGNGNGGGGVGGWLAGLVAGAVVLYFWHVVVVILIVGAVLAIAGLIVLLSWRAHRTLPYDAAWQDELPVPAHVAAQRYTAHASVAERRHAPEYLPVAEPMPAIEHHNHLHLHGVDAAQLAEVAALLRRSGRQDFQAVLPESKPDGDRLAIEQPAQHGQYQDAEAEPVNHYRP